MKSGPNGNCSPEGPVIPRSRRNLFSFGENDNHDAGTKAAGPGPLGCGRPLAFGGCTFLPFSLPTGGQNQFKFVQEESEHIFPNSASFFFSKTCVCVCVCVFVCVCVS